MLDFIFQSFPKDRVELSNDIGTAVSYPIAEWSTFSVPLKSRYCTLMAAIQQKYIVYILFIDYIV